MRGQTHEVKCTEKSRSDKSLGVGGAGVIIHLDKLFILHMALPSAGCSTIPLDANVLTCMYSTTSMGSGLQLRYMALIRLTKMQTNETSGCEEVVSTSREIGSDAENSGLFFKLQSPATLR